MGPEQRDTLLVAVKAVGLGGVVLLAVNVFLVGWVTALLRRPPAGAPERAAGIDPTPR